MLSCHIVSIIREIIFIIRSSLTSWVFAAYFIKLSHE